MAGPGLRSNQVECAVLVSSLNLQHSVCEEPDFPVYHGRLLTTSTFNSLCAFSGVFNQIIESCVFGWVALRLQGDCKYSQPYGAPKSKANRSGSPRACPRKEWVLRSKRLRSPAACWALVGLVPVIPTRFDYSLLFDIGLRRVLCVTTMPRMIDPECIHRTQDSYRGSIMTPEPGTERRRTGQYLCLHFLSGQTVCLFSVAGSYRLLLRFTPFQSRSKCRLYRRYRECLYGVLRTH